MHSTIYSLFISAFPEEVGSKMPREIWEKVWRFTQTPYDEFLTYNAGFRSVRRIYKLVEFCLFLFWVGLVHKTSEIYWAVDFL